MQTVPFYIVDVFANAPYKGNQLAVFLQAQNLTTQQMLQMAQEIGFAESSFVVSDKPTTAGFPTRIFTVEYEVPFAGHPTLGTAFVIQQFLLREQVPELSLQVQVGQIPVSITYTNKVPDFLLMQQINPSFQPEISKEEVAQLFKLPGNALHPEYPIQEVSTGLPFLIIPLQKLSDMRALQVTPEHLQHFLEKHNLYKTQRPDGLTVALYFFCPETYSPEHQLNARMLALENGQVIEDAATGSANGCLLAYLLKHRYFGQDQLDLLVEQGYEMNRNSTIKLQGHKSEGNEFELKVGGQVQLIAKGEWYV